MVNRHSLALIVLSNIWHFGFGQNAPTQCNIDSVYFGGYTSFIHDFYSTFDYPSELKGSGVYGSFILKIEINSSGEIENVELSKSIHPAIELEVKRVLLKFRDKWKVLRITDTCSPYFVSTLIYIRSYK